MPSLIDKIFPRGKFLPKPVDANEEETDLSPDDFSLDNLPPGENESGVVEMVTNRFKTSAQAKRLLEREWLLDIAFRRGNQWVEWREGVGLRDTRNPGDPHRSYKTANLIRPTVNKIIARATMSKPDASIAPESSRPEDIAAAPEARDGVDHYDRKFDRQAQTREWVDSVLTSSTSCLKIVWNPDAKAAVPMGAPAAPQAMPSAPVATQPPAGADPSQGGAGAPPQMPPLLPMPKAAGRHGGAVVGDIEEVIVPPFELFPDPKARNWGEVRWIIHAKRHPLSYFQAKYGKRGYKVKSDSTGTDTYSYIDLRLDSIMGTDTRAQTEQTKMATLYEMWELPTPGRYEEGRRIDVAGGELLEYTKLPYDFCIERALLPFVPLQLSSEYGTLWSANAVHDLIECQMGCNETLSRIQDRVNNETCIIVEEEGAESGADNPYISPYAISRVKYRKGSAAPQVMNPSPVNESLFTVLQTYKGLMEDISGVHDVSNGSVPPGVTAGNAIELLQQSDTTQMSPFTANIESAQVTRAMIEVELIAQFYKEPRLVSLSTEGDPEQAMAAVRSFEALRAGGRVGITVSPGSATPKTPAARNQMILDMSKAGMFQPDQLGATAAMMEIMSLDRSDIMQQRIEDLAKQQQASQPDPAAVEQQKMQAAQQAAQADQQHEAQLAAIQDHSEQMTQDREFQHQAQLKALEHQHELDKMRLQNELDIEKERALRTLPPAIAPIAVTADPTATVAIEKEAGVAGKVPPLPTPAAGAKPAVKK